MKTAASASFVRMFKPRFAALVEKGEKLQTHRAEEHEPMSTENQTPPAKKKKTSNRVPLQRLVRRVRVMRRMRGVRLIAHDYRRRFRWTIYIVLVWRGSRFCSCVSTGEFRWALQCYKAACAERAQSNTKGSREAR